MTEQVSALDCPSAQPEMARARAFGVIVGTPDKPEVAYFKSEATVDLSQLKGLRGTTVTEVFRIAAACEESRCAHFDGHRCTLGQRIVQQLPPVVDALPPCTVRLMCRWYREQGREACFRCPQLVTLGHHKDESLVRAARPPPDPAKVGLTRDESLV
jgi:hypothetical protein